MGGRAPQCLALWHVADCGRRVREATILKEEQVPSRPVQTSHLQQDLMRMLIPHLRTQDQDLATADKHTLFPLKERVNTIRIAHEPCHRVAPTRARHLWSAPSSH